MYNFIATIYYKRAAEAVILVAISGCINYNVLFIFLGSNGTFKATVGKRLVWWGTKACKFIYMMSAL